MISLGKGEKKRESISICIILNKSKSRGTIFEYQNKQNQIKILKRYHFFNSNNVGFKQLIAQRDWKLP